MHSLQQLFSGELKGINHLKLSAQLTNFPKEIFDLSDTLEILDLSNNNLSQLPNNFGDLKKLKIAFFSNNNFTELPEVLSHCPSLTMIGFRANKINHISENALPKNTRWLILTDNYLTALPKAIGNCHQLQKVALAGNQLKELPIEMFNCKNLELLRISVNKITILPEWLGNLPRLSWLAYAGNPCCYKVTELSVPTISWDELNIQEQLGEGASGIISKAQWKSNNTNVALKLFKGDITSDGLPEDEIAACIKADKHPNLVPVIGKLVNHPTFKKGLIFELIPPLYKNLGNPPSFDTCTRDTYAPDTQFTTIQILKTSLSIADILNHLHSKNILHGDVYAHNILIDDNHNTLLGDFGAASIYTKNETNSINFEKIDVRAYGCLLEDLLNMNSDNETGILNNNLNDLKNKCLDTSPNKRPTFSEIKTLIDTYL